MTDIQQIVLEFARKCEAWPDAYLGTGNTVRTSLLAMPPGAQSIAIVFTDMQALDAAIKRFLGTRYWLQINRDTSTGGSWRVLIGVQNVAVRGASRETVTATNEDLAHAMMEACVLAAGQLKLGVV